MMDTAQEILGDRYLKYEERYLMDAVFHAKVKAVMGIMARTTPEAERGSVRDVRARNTWIRWTAFITVAAVYEIDEGILNDKDR